MTGSGGDGGAPEIHRGEFLQQFPRNPPQEPASQNTSNDPAVAPSVSLSPSMYQNNTHNRHLPYNPPPHLHFAPHNFFLRTPNPNLITASLPHPGLDQNQYSHDSNSVGAANSKPISAHKQQVKSESGSLDIRNTAGVSNSRLGNKIPYGLDIEFQKSLNLNWNNGPGGNSRWGPTPGRRPPPVISSNATSVGNRSGGFEQNVSKGKSKTRELNGKNVNSVKKYEKERGMGRGMPGERRFSHQLDKPALTAHSANASDFQESLMGLHREVKADQMRSDDDRIKSELVDSEGIVDALVLEVESTDKNKQKVTRNKDYRADKRGRWILNQQMRILKRRIECRSDIHRLNIPLLEIYESLIPSEEEKAKQNQLLALLKKHVNKEWPEGRLYLYGSCDNLFGFKKSDIDVCLEIDDTDVNKPEVLLKLASILQSDNLQNVQALTRTRVPIVKLMDPASGISCDICVNNLLAVINTKLLRDYALIDGRLRQLAFIIKHWAKSRGVNVTYQGTLSSYAYVLMCINFLQQRNPAILPCLQGMERTYAVTVDNTECAYFDHVDKLIGFGSQNIESIAKLVWEFFNYWAYYHDYTSGVISVRTGSTLNKREKDWTRRVGNDRHLICIEDPFEISHDLGRVVDKYSLRVLREEFERAAKIMQDDPDPWVTLFEPYVPS